MYQLSGADFLPYHNKLQGVAGADEEWSGTNVPGTAQLLHLTIHRGELRHRKTAPHPARDSGVLTLYLGSLHAGAHVRENAARDKGIKCNSGTFNKALPTAHCDIGKRDAVTNQKGFVAIREERIDRGEPRQNLGAHHQLKCLLIKDWFK